MTGFQNILALDTALSGCSAAVLAGKKRAVRREAMPRGQAEFLVPFAQEVMGQAGLEYEDLDAVLCTVGPGAFTGLRIGMSAARAFALALDLPVFGVTTTQAMALSFAEVQPDEACTVILETKRRDFYVQSFDAQGRAVAEAAAVDAQEVGVPEGAVLIGDGVERFLGLQGLENVRTESSYMLPDMLVCARTLQAHGEDSLVFTIDPKPVYLRGADVSFPKHKPRALRGF